MKTIIIVLLLLIGFLFVHPQIQVLFGQLGALEQMISHMRLTHSQLTNNIDEVKQLVENNNTSEALNLLDGMDIKINHMNTMFNDLVWELSNRGH
jgi:predicted DNA-binding ArsR family transcriptional regulator